MLFNSSLGWFGPAFATLEVNGFQPKALVFVSEKRCAFAAGKLIVEMDVESKKQRCGELFKSCHIGKRKTWKVRELQNQKGWENRFVKDLDNKNECLDKV